MTPHIQFIPCARSSIVNVKSSSCCFSIIGSLIIIVPCRRQILDPQLLPLTQHITFEEQASTQVNTAVLALRDIVAVWQMDDCLVVEVDILRERRDLNDHAAAIEENTVRR
jgi:hypothetical protein